MAWATVGNIFACVEFGPPITNTAVHLEAPKIVIQRLILVQWPPTKQPGTIDKVAPNEAIRDDGSV
jgi:hypothetical protein